MSFEFDFQEHHVQTLLHPNPKYEEWYAALSDVLPRYDITSVPRVAMFLAQTSHESGNYVFLEENLHYKAAALMRIWPKRFPEEVANQVAGNPEAIANIAYSDRMGNGNPDSGDGWNFHGRGLIQLTGRTNYEKFARAIGKGLEETVDYCATPDGAVESACFFWKEENLNKWSDENNIVKVTEIINGGTLGIEDRTGRYQHGLRVLQE
jgi:putative chitinase